MKKSLLILAFILFVVSILTGVDESTKKKFGNTTVVKAAEVEVVKFEAMKPDIERYQKKSDTDFTSGFFQLYKNNLRKTNKVLLNKWLKESK